MVHAVLEEPSPPRFVLTGSSARKLRRGDVNLPGGRALHRTLHPFMAAELPDFDLERALRIGLVPMVVDGQAPESTLDAYASLYIDQEVRAEGLTRNVGAFARFLEAITFSHGGQLNISAVARECEVGRKAVVEYVAILEDLLVAFRLPVFRKRAKRATVARDKLYLFDAGVFRSLRPTGPLDRPGEIDGQALASGACQSGISSGGSFLARGCSTGCEVRAGRSTGPRRRPLPRQPERHQPPRPPHLHDHMLHSLVTVRHHPVLPGPRHLHRAHALARRLVVRVQHRRPVRPFGRIQQIPSDHLNRQPATTRA